MHWGQVVRPDRSQVSQSTRFPEQAVIEKINHKPMQVCRKRYALVWIIVDGATIMVDSEAYSKL